MTLHGAIEKLLLQIGHSLTISEIAEELNKNNWYHKKDGSKITAFQIHGRTRNYLKIFDRNGTTVSLLGYKSLNFDSSKKLTNNPTTSETTSGYKDEHYVLDLCDKVLHLSCSRQHRFDFLRGDINIRGYAAKLPIDGYYRT
jgi:hypothetical protein